MHWMLIVVLSSKLAMGRSYTVRYMDFPSRTACRAKGAQIALDADQADVRMGAWACVAQAPP